MSQPDETVITDTERMDYLASLSERTQGLEPGEFRRHLDEQIRARVDDVLLPPPSPWIDLTQEFPPDEVPVRVRTSANQVGRVCYSSIAGCWFFFCPGTAIHGREWDEVFGREPEITHWQPDTEKGEG